MQNGKVIVVFGPTGVGKTTITHYLKEKWGIPQVITHTTRAPRIGEVNGQDYYFESPESFTKNHYLEDVTYAGNHYGSSWEGLERAWQQHKIASIVLDSVGAETYMKELGDDVVLLYVTISNPKILMERLRQRGDLPAAMEKRLNSADFERDLALPDALKGKATVIKNDDWPLTKSALDRLVEKLES